MVRSKLVLQVRPKYPKEAQVSGLQGKVSLRCIIETDGSVGAMDVIEGQEPFVQASKKAVAQWKYRPVVLNGVAVRAETAITVIFKLPREKSKKLESTYPRN